MALRMDRSGSLRSLNHYNSVPDHRKEDIHMVSVVGGLYGLNLIPLWQPKRITIFDINPASVTYFRLIRHVFTTSDNAQHFLQRLTDADYEAHSKQEEFVRENIRLKQQGSLPRERGSTKRDRKSTRLNSSHGSIS